MQKLRRWHWMLLSLLIGLGIGFARIQLDDLGLEAFGASINSQAQFERDITTSVRLAGGEERRVFDNLSVVRVPDPKQDRDRGILSLVRNGAVATARLPGHGYAVGDRVTISGADQAEYNGAFRITAVTPDTFDYAVSPTAPTPATGSDIRCVGPTRLIYVVMGTKLVIEAPPPPGSSRSPQDRVRRYLPHIYRPPTPYIPIMKVSGDPPSSGSKLERLAERLGLKAPDPPDSIIAFLRRVEQSHGVRFSYQWWQQPRFRLAAWTVGSFVVIGLIWPTLVNIMAFGSFFRPPEPKKPRLPKRKPPPQRVAQEQIERAAAMDDVKAMGERLAAELEARGAGGPVAEQPAAAPPAPKPLTATKLEVDQKANLPQEQKVFGADEDDYYPTEVHVRKPHQD